MPKGIGAKELADKGQAWLRDNDFVMKNGQYVQQSGDKNSLGLVKFDMKDDEAIYLHDTPAKAVFALPDRHRSHGCVRVENAVQFAPRLPARKAYPTNSNKAMQKDDEAFIKLPRQIPVRLLYQTAFWDGSRIQFRPDIYGWDENIAKALGPCAGTAAQDPSSPKAATTSGHNVLRAPDFPAPPAPHQREYRSIQPRASGRKPSSAAVAELGDPAVELEPHLAGRAVALLGDDHFGAAVGALHLLLPLGEIGMVVGAAAWRQDNNPRDR